MKQSVLAVLLICALPKSGLAQRWISLDVPRDTPESRSVVHNRVELKNMADEYREIIETHFRPLKVEDIDRIFGPKLEEHVLNSPDSRLHLANDLALPLFEQEMIGLSGLLVTNDRSHRVMHAAGDTGNVEFFYHWDGDTLGPVVFYAHPDDKFVPFKTADNFRERMEWDKAKLATFKRWVDEHMPKLTDLGEVEVSESSPRRVDLGGDQACVIKTRVLHHPNVTNLWFEIEIVKETASPSEREKSRQRRSFDHAGQSVGFAMDGKFYRLTPKLVEQIRAPRK